MELAALYGFTDEVCMTPDEVAVEMAALVEEGTKYPGGTILQTTRRGTKVLPPPEGYEESIKVISGANGSPGEKIKGERGALV